MKKLIYFLLAIALCGTAYGGDRQPVKEVIGRLLESPKLEVLRALEPEYGYFSSEARRPILKGHTCLLVEGWGLGVALEEAQWGICPSVS